MKEMATRSSILAWRIPSTEEPGGLQSMGLQRVGHDSGTNTFIYLSGGESLTLMLTWPSSFGCVITTSAPFTKEDEFLGVTR